MEDKVYFNPGDLVRVSKLNKKSKNVIIGPDMIVKGRYIEDGEFAGLVCFWFTEDKKYQEATFNTKDLELVEL